MKEYQMTERVGDRDKVAYSIKSIAFALLAGSQSKCQKVIEIVYEQIDSGGDDAQ